MRVIPAVDLREGACVQLVGGSFEREALRIADPLAAAARWRDAGFTELHVVDLDAAVTGDRKINSSVFDRLITESRMETQVGGGMRDTAVVERAFAKGAARVVTGTRALQDPDWLATITTRWPERIVVAVDVAGGRPVVRGWRSISPLSLDDALSVLRDLPVAGLLVTSVDVEGRMQGPDIPLYDRMMAHSAVPLIASGGIGGANHLRQLREIGVAASVVGMALYTGVLDARAIAEEFAA
jgi:phosphoribosylformimino-5-aminoimidazole carboxamide ribotide isomerase